MSGLLSLTATIEAATGLALIIAPAFVVKLMLGSPLETYAAVTLGHIAGAALLALGVAAGLARGDRQGGATRGLVTAILIYNLGVSVILGAAGIPRPANRRRPVAGRCVARCDGRMVHRVAPERGR
jgi:hypothetical protein